MKFRAKVEVRLKPGLTDAEGLFARSSLRDLGFDVEDVRVGKVYYITLNASTLEDARGAVDLMCRRLLANPEVKDDYDFTVEPL
ncbi:MAG: phosphoribosylformylglycinamidine synthase subunit PurS [Candidatus Nezhaarchaeales archaeon]